MPKKRHSAEAIITKLREAEVLQAKSQTLVQVCKAMSRSIGQAAVTLPLNLGKAFMSFC